MRIRWLRWLAGILLVIVAALLGAGLWTRHLLRASLPALDGEFALSGLAAPVTVERDANGVPAITGLTRLDVARATGFIHAQDRFFQMDLSRRRAAGELSELVGPAALNADRTARLHRMRARAARVLAAADAAERAPIEAYTEGVNAGLAALGAKPFEYLILGAEPAPWRPEDSVLVLAAMFFILQDSEGVGDIRAGLVYGLLPRALADFLSSVGDDWDTPLQGEPMPAPALPGPGLIDLRGRRGGAAGHREGSTGPGEPWPAGIGPPASSPPALEFPWGSNNWAVSGAYTASGAAILANDMHLGLSVPNTWYRASLVWTAQGGGRVRVTGVTLPGLPLIVVGSNGSIAWGFTNSAADYTDIVTVEPDPSDPGRYLAPGGSRPFEVHREVIKVKGRGEEVLDVRETVWGPLAGPDARGGARAICWVPHEPDGMNLRFFAIETAQSLDQALDIANRSGIPAQNFVVATSDGHIGWSIAGRIPRRVGFDGRVPVSRADGTRRWDGWMAPEEYARVVDPPSGRIYTANNRVAGGAFFQALGLGSYDEGARVRQIRDDLLAIGRATPADMLKVQLDDRAVFLERWRGLALSVLSDAAVAGNQARQEFRRLVRDTWSGRASIESAGYRLVRAFRLKVAAFAFGPVLEPVRKADPSFPATPGLAYEGPLWRLVAEQPRHLLSPAYAGWNGLLLAAADGVAKDLTEGGRPLEGRTWGERNTVQIRHPLTRALPLLSRWLDMPPEELPGDSNMPRVQSPEFGASERLAVSPGREEEGYFHMPGGQSGHPLSPYYRAGHRAWAQGEPASFLPGPAVHRLRLAPAR